MTGKLESVFSIAWQNVAVTGQPSTALISAVGEAGSHMVVKSTLYDKSKKEDSSSKFQD